MCNKYFLISLFAAGLSACGGGGGGSTSSMPPASTTVPGAPTAVSAVAGNGQASLSFSPPVSDGGSAITGYSARCASASNSVSANASSSPITVTGLSNGVSYSCSISASNAVGTGAASTSVSVTPVAPTSSFSLSSSVGSEGGTLPAQYTCDGNGGTPDLSWSGAPAGTQEYALMMTTLPGDGSTKWNWILYRIPASTTALSKDSYGVGVNGIGSDGPMAAYQPPCSQGPGAKLYTYTLYALSAPPQLDSSIAHATGTQLSAAIAAVTLASATLNLNYSRTTMTGSSVACTNVRNSTTASNSGYANVSCDDTYAYVGSDGIATHTMMDGITATNLQVPVRQNFFGSNAWKIPLSPAIANTTTSAVDGPIGVAINGVPIFNPCKQGGCQNGDTKALGELDVCNGHAGRADDYHYHAAPTCLMAGKNSNYWDTHPIGWALDGFAIFGYHDADGSTAERDNVCGGNSKPVSNAPTAYSYHVTDASPYVLSCFRGIPSPDLANQSSKFKPFRQPPVTPFNVFNMSLKTDPADDYTVVQFTSAQTFVTTETGSDSYSNVAGTYRIRYKPVTGAALTELLTLNQNKSKSACWHFQFQSESGAASQPDISYCR